MRKVISIMIASLFLINSLSFGLSVPNTSSDMDPEVSDQTKDLMYIMAESKFLQEHPERDVSKPRKFKNPVAESEFSSLDIKFFVRRLRNFKGNNGTTNPYKEQVLPGSEINPIYKINDLVKAFEYFRDNEANISKDFLDIKIGYFPMKENTFVPARIEKNPEGSSTPYTLIVHTEFEQMWEHIKANDVWFEKEIKKGDKRIISVAWGIFYRIAKHEMTDWRDGGRITKGGGHIHKKQGPGSGKKHGIMESEEFANSIYGNYGLINDAILLWFIGAYKYSNAVRYDNKKFEKVVRSFFDREKELERINKGKAIQMDILFPRIGFSPSRELEEAIILAKGINQNFFSNAPYSEENGVKPLLHMPVIMIEQKHIDEYEARSKKNPALDKSAMSMALKTEEEPLRVLLVDDSSIIRTILKERLTEGFHREVIIDVAGNGAEGLEKVKSAENNYDIILSDLQMPEMDGQTFINVLKTDPEYAGYKNIPAILMSTEDEKILEKTAKMAGADGFHQKDGTVKKLFDEMDRVVDKEKNEDSGKKDNQPAKEEPVTLLILEDQEPILRLVKRIIESMKLNLEIIVAGTGSEGLKEVKKMVRENKLPEVILSDMKMPDMNGAEFFQEFAKFEGCSSTLVITTTGYDGGMRRQIPEEINIVGHIDKPFANGDLKNIIGDVVAAAELMKKEKKERQESSQTVSDLEMPDLIGEDAKETWNGQKLSREEKEAIWTTVNLSREENIEILLPQSIMLNDEVKKDLIRMYSKYANIRWNRYSTKITSEEYIRTILADRKAEDEKRKIDKKKPFKRIVITDPEVNNDVKYLAFEGGQPYLFKDVKVLQVDMRKNFSSEEDQRKHHSRLIQIAILTRLFKGEDKTPKVGLVLENLLKNTVTEGINFNAFMEWLGVEEDENTDEMDIKARLANLLADSMVVDLVELLEREYCFVREFKKYA